LTIFPRTIRDAYVALRSGAISSVELTHVLLNRANHLDPVLGTYISRFDDAALQRAERADRELSSGMDLGMLHGIPLGVKDVIACSEATTTAQSLVMDQDWSADLDAPVVSRIRQAGAIIIGKTTTMEFACGLPDDSKPFPLPRNPWNTEAWSGGQVPELPMG